MKPALFRTAARSAGDRLPELLELGGDDGWTAFLKRLPGEKEPAILLQRAGDEGSEPRPEVIAHLDSTLAVGRTRCPVCKARQPGWPRYCGVCKTDLAPASDDPDADLVVPRGYQHLGWLRRAEGGGPLHFARELATGRVVGMVEKPAADGSVDLLPVWAATPASARGRGWRAAVVGGSVLAAAALLITIFTALRDPRISAPDVPTDTNLVQKQGVAPQVPGVQAPPVQQPDSTLSGGTLPASSPSGTAAAETVTPASGAPSTSLRTDAERETPPPATTPRPPAATPPAPTPRGVEAAIGRYASAVGSGETARIRRVYRGITAAEVNRWNRFFAPLGPRAGLRVSYEVVSGPILEGSRAEVIFTLNLSYTDPAGTPMRQSLPLRALLEWTGTDWSLQEVRLLQ